MQPVPMPFEKPFSALPDPADNPAVRRAKAELAAWLSSSKINFGEYSAGPRAYRRHPTKYKRVNTMIRRADQALRKEIRACRG